MYAIFVSAHIGMPKVVSVEWALSIDFFSYLNQQAIVLILLKRKN